LIHILTNLRYYQYIIVLPYFGGSLARKKQTFHFLDNIL